MTSGKPGRRFWISASTSKCRPCVPVNLKAPWLVPMAQARESQPERLTNSSAWSGIGQLGVGFVDRDVLFDAAELAQFRLDDDALGVRRVDHAPGDLDVLLERLVAGVDHDRAVEAAVDAVHAGLLVAVVQVDGEDRHRGRSRRPRGSWPSSIRLSV